MKIIFFFCKTKIFQNPRRTEAFARENSATAVAGVCCNRRQLWHVSDDGNASCRTVRYELPCCAAAVSVVVYRVVVVVGSVRRHRRRVPVRSRPSSLRLVRATMVAAAAVVGPRLVSPLMQKKSINPRSLLAERPGHFGGRVHCSFGTREERVLLCLLPCLPSLSR